MLQHTLHFDQPRAIKRMALSLAIGLSGMVLLLSMLSGGKLNAAAMAGNPYQVSPPGNGPVDARSDAALTVATEITGSKPWIWLLCKFSGVATEPATLDYFRNLSNTLDSYFREISYSKANIAGSNAVGWYTLPYSLAHYAPGTSAGRQEAARDCTSAADADVNFAQFYGLNLMFNDDLLGSSIYGLSSAQLLTLDGVTQSWPTVFQDTKGGYNMALSAHEMYHGFGLSHSSAYSPTTQEDLGSSWDPIGVGACGFSSCTPSHLPAPQKYELGWITPTNIYTATAISQTVTLEALALPQTNNYLMVKIPLGSSQKRYYTLEARRRVGAYDGKLPSTPTVLIHEVNLQDTYPFGPYSNGHIRLVPRLPNVVDQPWGTGAIWTVGHVFSDTTNGITVTVLSTTTTGYVVRVNVRPAVTTTLYVDADATGANNGTSWANAYKRLQDALAAANPTGNDTAEIWVAEGTYAPTTGSVQSATFQLKNSVKIYGGFAATETVRSQRNVEAHQTILSGDLLGNDNSNVAPSEPTRADNSYHVVTSSGVDTSAALDGVTISGGNAISGSSLYGGGLYNSSGTPTLNEIIFRGNTASQGGGGLYNSSGNLTLSNLEFLGNTVDGSGGGLYNWSSNPTIVNVVFAGNVARYRGGGLLNGYGNDVKLVNVTFVSNTAAYYSNSAGGGIYNHYSIASLANTILWGNRDYPHGVTAAGQLTGTYSNSFTVTYSLVQGSYTGTGNISSNPLFVDADGADNIIGTADDNMRLQDTSPAIDAGDNDAVPLGVTTDLDGNPRFYNHPRADTGHGTPPIVDMGAFEKITVPAPLLSIGKAVAPNNAVKHSSWVTYTVYLNNAGQLDASNVMLTDTLPVSVTFTSWVQQSGAAVVIGNEIRWTGDVTVGQSVTFTWVASQTAAYGQTVVNTARYSHATGSNVAQASFVVEVGPYRIFLPVVVKQ